MTARARPTRQSMQPAACGREVRFAPDSLLEGNGFELPVPATRRPGRTRSGESSVNRTSSDMPRKNARVDSRAGAALEVGGAPA